jgi:hypothetical protein
VWWRRADAAQALSDSEAGDAIFKPVTATSKKPRRHKAYFEVRIFSARRAALPEPD